MIIHVQVTNRVGRGVFIDMFARFTFIEVSLKFIESTFMIVGFWKVIMK